MLRVIFNITKQTTIRIINQPAISLSAGNPGSPSLLIANPPMETALSLFAKFQSLEATDARIISIDICRQMNEKHFEVRNPVGVRTFSVVETVQCIMHVTQSEVITFPAKKNCQYM
jgi:hypothetical protein